MPHITQKSTGLEHETGAVPGLPHRQSAEVVNEGQKNKRVDFAFARQEI